MKTSKTIQKAEKLSGEKVQIIDRLHFVNYRGYTIQWYPNGRIEDDPEVTCIYSKKYGANDDYATDYFCGTFHDNLTQAFKFVDILIK